LEEAIQEMKMHIDQDTIIIGHGLNSDFDLLKIHHERIIDTMILYPHPDGLPFKKALRDLALEFLQ
jgi:RNA exonuclease 1